ncbi:MAG: hypothetical protein WD023_05000 [Ilumatobacteraceae bacterium]
MAYGTIDHEYAMQMATTPPESDGPVLMVNFMKYRPIAQYRDADEAGDVSGREADDRYAPVDVLDAIGATVAFLGDVVDADGNPDPTWDRIGIVKYPTRTSFIEMQSRPDFRAKHVHKRAGMEFTIVVAALPTGAVVGQGDGAGIVRFVALPAGVGPASLDEGALLRVEGRIIGDERNFDRMAVHFTDGSDDELAALPGVIAVRTRATIERLRGIIDDWA